MNENIDFLIMKLRTLAAMRGATPVEIQRNVNANVNALDGLGEIIYAKPTLRQQYIDFDD